ncbi:unnamed protein product [Mucor hiemalis]
MQLNNLIVSISLAVSTVSAFNLFGGPTKSELAIVHGGNMSAIYAASYLAPFASDDAEEASYELIDDHEDLIEDRHGSVVSLRKRGDDCQKYHKVVRGDNCWLLGLKYNVNMSSIYEWNDHINSKCTNLYPGKSYCVSKGSDSSVLEKACVDTYFVKDADTCITVAKQHNITLDQFYDMNPSVNRGSCDNLLTGGNYCIKEQPQLTLNNKVVANKAAKKKTSAISTKVSRSTKHYKSHTKKRTSRRTSATTTSTKKTASIKKKYVKKTTLKKTSTKKSTTTTKKTTTKKTTTKKPTTTTTTTKKSITTTTKKPTTTTTTTTKKPTTTTTTTTKTTTTSTKTTTTSKEPQASSSSDKRKLLQKNSALTYYWIAHPDDGDHGGKDVTVKTCDGKALGTVPSEYADALVMEGTGVLGNKIVNLGGCSCSNYKCFMEVDKKEDPYGLTCKSTLYKIKDILLTLLL